MSGTPSLLRVGQTERKEKNPLENWIKAPGKISMN